MRIQIVKEQKFELKEWGDSFCKSGKTVSGVLDIFLLKISFYWIYFCCKLAFKWFKVFNWLS